MSFLINPFLFSAPAACSCGISFSGLSGYWTMDGDLNDYTGFLFNGTGSSVSYTTSPAMFSSAINLTGTNTYSNFGNSQILQSAVTFSISAWIYPRTLNSYQCIIDNYGYDSLGPYRIMVNNANNTILASIGTNDVTFASNILTANTWHHIVLTKTSTSVAKLYVNGTEYNFGTNTTRTSGNSKLVIGSRWRQSAGTFPDSFFDGLVDDVAYFKRTLSQSEVTTIYTAGTVSGCRLLGSTTFDPTTVSGMTVWLKGDTGLNISGGTIYQWDDQSGNNNHFTQTNNSTYRPTDGTGKVTFDGTDDFLTASTTCTVGHTFVVMKPTGLTEYGQLVGTTTLHMFMRWDAAMGIQNMYYDAGTIYGSASFASQVRRNSTSSTVLSTNKALFAVNGTPATNQTILLGKDIKGGHPTSGDIFEIIIFNRQLTTTERDNIEGYLRIKHGIF